LSLRYVETDEILHECLLCLVAEEAHFTLELSRSRGYTMAGQMDVIYLPDQRQTKKKVTSGSANRQRQHLEQFRTDDAEHAALHALVRASGKSLGGFVMELVRIEAGSTSRPRLYRPCVHADMAAFLQAMVEFRRGNSLLNQQTRAVNTAMLFAEERGAAQLQGDVREWRRALDRLHEQFALAVASIHEALGDEREG
jgi:hypothetical protein